VRTPLARTALTFPAVLNLQFVVQVAALASSIENPASGMATCVRPLINAGEMISTFNVVSVEAVVTVTVVLPTTKGVMTAGTAC